jgi:hypothetical protein
MIRNLLLIIGTAIVVFLGACSSSKMSIVASWVNAEEIKPEPYKSVFIIVLTGNLPAKKAIENDLAVAAEARGLKAYKSVVVFGPFSGKESIPSKDLVSKKTASLGVEALFTVALVNKEIETTYVPSTTYVSGPIYPTYGYYGSFGGYYNTYSTVYYDPGYYSTEKKYTLEANMYDAKTEKLLMSIETKAVNPAEIEKASQEYTALLAEAIAKLRPMKK